MISTGYFRELQRYSRNDILQTLGLTDPEGEKFIARLLRENILKIRKKDFSEDVSTEQLLASDIAVGEFNIEASEPRYIFDYVGLIVVSFLEKHFVINCFPKYIKGRVASISDMRKIVRTIEKDSNNDQFTIYEITETGNKLHYNPLSVAVFLLRDFSEYGKYTNEKNILEKNGRGEIDWDVTIDQTFPLLRNGRPFYVDYYATENTDDSSDYITRLHECIITQCSRYLNETQLSDLFDIETPEPYEGELSDFGNNDYIEQRILSEINVQFVTRKQILLRALYAFVHKLDSAEQKSGLSLFGTNSFNKIWENVCADVFASQLKAPIKNLPICLSSEYKNDPRCLLDLIPHPQWTNYKNGKEQKASKTLIPDYISIYNKDDLSYFVIMDAKYYDINLPPQLSGNPGVDDVDKQYLYQLAYRDFIESHNLIPINAFLCPGDIETFEIAGEVEMPVFAGLDLTNIKVAILSAQKMLEAYLAGKQLDLYRELPNLFPVERRGTVSPETLKDGKVLRMLVNQFDDEPTKQHYIAVLRCLRDSFIWIPGNMKISDIDENTLKNAKVGDTFSPQNDMRFVPDILQKDDEFFLPVFSNAEQMGEYGKHFSKIEKHFFEAIRLVLAREDVCGIVLDPFTAPYVARKEDFDFIGSLPSMLKLDNDEGEE